MYKYSIYDNNWLNAHTIDNCIISKICKIDYFFTSDRVQKFSSFDMIIDFNYTFLELGYKNISFINIIDFYICVLKKWVHKSSISDI